MRLCFVTSIMNYTYGIIDVKQYYESVNEYR